MVFFWESLVKTSLEQLSRHEGSVRNQIIAKSATKNGKNPILSHFTCPMCCPLGHPVQCTGQKNTGPINVSKCLVILDEVWDHVVAKDLVSFDDLILKT